MLIGDDDPVSQCDHLCGKAHHVLVVCDEDDDFVGKHVFKQPKQSLFHPRIQRRCDFVKHDDLGVAEDRPYACHHLSLTARKVASVFPGLRIQSLLQSGEHVLQPGLRQEFIDHARVDVLHAVRDVFVYATIEQRRVLLDVCYLRPHLVRVGVLVRNTVYI